MSDLLNLLRRSTLLAEAVPEEELAPKPNEDFHRYLTRIGGHGDIDSSQQEKVVTHANALQRVASKNYDSLVPSRSLSMRTRREFTDTAGSTVDPEVMSTGSAARDAIIRRAAAVAAEEHRRRNAKVVEKALATKAAAERAADIRVSRSMRAAAQARLNRGISPLGPTSPLTSDACLSRTPLLIEAVMAGAVGPSPLARPDLIGHTLAGSPGRLGGPTDTSKIGLRSSPSGYPVLPGAVMKEHKKRSSRKSSKDRKIARKPAKLR